MKYIFSQLDKMYTVAGHSNHDGIRIYRIIWWRLSIINLSQLKFIKELVSCDILLCNISGQLVKDNKN